MFEILPCDVKIQARKDFAACLLNFVCFCKLFDHIEENAGL